MGWFHKQTKKARNIYWKSAYCLSLVGFIYEPFILWRQKVLKFTNTNEFSGYSRDSQPKI